MAVAIAEKYKSELIILNVIQGRTYDQSKAAAEKGARELVDKEMEIAHNHQIQAKGEILPPAESIVGQIINYANRQNANLIVMGSRGLGGFRKMVIGSVSSGVVTHAQCPVLVVR